MALNWRRPIRFPMANIVALPKPAADIEIVERLQDMLDRAKRGEVVSVAIAAQTRHEGAALDTANAFSFGEDGDVAHLVCAIERLKLRLLAAGHDE